MRLRRFFLSGSKDPRAVGLDHGLRRVLGQVRNREQFRVRSFLEGLGAERYHVMPSARSSRRRTAASASGL